MVKLSFPLKLYQPRKKFCKIKLGGGYNEQGVMASQRREKQKRDFRKDSKLVQQSHNERGQTKIKAKDVASREEEGASGNSWNCSAVSTFGCFTD